jgi:hypothetical protein
MTLAADRAEKKDKDTSQFGPIGSSARTERRSNAPAVEYARSHEKRFKESKSLYCQAKLLRVFLSAGTSLNHSIRLACDDESARHRRSPLHMEEFFFLNKMAIFFVQI